MKYKICRQCKMNLPNTREYFKRQVNKDGSERLTDICKQCIEHNRMTEDWKDGKLLCHVCQQYKDADQFDINKNNKYRQQHDKRCKECKQKLHKQNLRRKTEAQKLYHILLSRLLAAKGRSKSKDIEFNITIDDLYELYNKQKGKCALSGITMTCDILSGRTSTNLSIDKIDHNKGYTKDNIQLVCMAVNEMKNDRTIEELKYFCECILKKK